MSSRQRTSRKPKTAPAPKARAPRRTSSEIRERAVQRVSSLIGRGKQGETIARALVKRGIKTRKALRKPDVLRTLPEDSQTNIKYPPAKNTQLAEADKLVDELTRRIIFCPVAGSSGGAPDCFRLPLYVVGSIRRRAPRIKDVDILVHLPERLAKYGERILASMRLTDSTQRDRVTLLESYLKGERHRASVVRWDMDDGSGPERPPPKYFHVDFFLVIGAELPFALFHYTGSKIYNVRTRAYAKRRGWLLNQYGLFVRKTGTRVPGSEKVKTEKDLANFLGVTYREPSDRSQ